MNSAANKAGKAGKIGRGSKKQLTLTQALAQFLAKTLLPDLKSRAKDSAVNAALMRQWQAERAAHRTADGFPAWETRTLEQVGAAWVLSCVFVRTLEDRDLLGRRRIAGPGAADSEQLFFEVAPSLTARDYLLTVFREVASLPGAEDLLGPAHNPAWRLSPSNEAARALLDFFRQQAGQGTTDAADTLVWRFDGDDTRFLGDLYQDLSEEVRKRYALLQTPGFVERFILDQTLEPAIAEFGLENVRLIDPTCGSGHFLLGAFDRLLSHRRQAAPAVDVRDHALAALGQVYGVDLNPYAVAIARFRLTLVYLQRTGITKLAQAPRLPLNLVVADSLLHGAKNTNVLFAEHETAGGDYEAWDAEMFALDDPQAAWRVFSQRYHAVVGNPPYITCKDTALREQYRERYRSAAGKYALAAPFTERFFDLATDDGFVGLINANSFMKREFGRALIEEVLPQFELTSVVDMSGAYVPGHGTPTVLLFGRNRRSPAAIVHAVLGKRGEPSTPEDAEQGLVWRSIVDHLREVGFENDFISVVEIACETFQSHPWSLGGGGAADLKALLEERAEKSLGEVAKSIGITSFTLEDDVYLAPRETYMRASVSESVVRAMVIGEVIRDWSIGEMPWAFFPYDDAFVPVSDSHPSLSYLWRFRTSLSNNKLFGGKTKVKGGLKWYEYGRLTADKLRTPLSIAFAFVATHNHFVLDRGGRVFKQSAPIVKLPESATEDDHLALLSYLNSSTACFWMKQVFQPKHSAEHKTHPEPERNRYEHAGTALAELPLPPGLFRDPVLIEAARSMDDLARSRAHALGVQVGVERAPSMPNWHQADLLRERMVALQEDIDWRIYSLFGLFDWGDHEIDNSASCPRGRRPSEMVEPRKSMVRRRDHLVPLPEAELPPCLPLSASLEREWGRRREAILTDDRVAFVEKPMFKRQWRDTDENIDEFAYRRAEEVRVLGGAFADAAEAVLRSGFRVMSARRVIDELRVMEVSGRGVLSTIQELRGISENDLLLEEAVPNISAETYAESGMQVLASWRKTWALQLREDRGEAVGDIPVPPKYDPKDYRDAAFWRLRGKLDVPKERFISYPGCEKDGDPSPLIGWAGWNHLQRAQALVALYQERKNEDGWSRDRLMPMLVGLHELMFWLELWHSQPDAGSQSPAREFKQFLDAELHAHALTTDDLEGWRPPVRKSSARRGATRVSGDLPEVPEDGTEGDDDAGVRPRRSRRHKADIPSETT